MTVGLANLDEAARSDALTSPSGSSLGRASYATLSLGAQGPRPGGGLAVAVAVS